MENTLEVRWFVRGMPPAVVQRWFRLECPGKFLTTTESRIDRYAYGVEHLNKFSEFSDRRLNREEINLKLRQSNLELKLRQQEFGTYKFTPAKHLHPCEGKVEQWRKIRQQELADSILLSHNSSNKISWINVDKKREQKVERGVKSELTWLQIDDEPWWTIAFEMTQSDRQVKQDSCFRQVVEQGCQNYFGPKLSAGNSYGYSTWLLKFAPQAIDRNFTSKVKQNQE